MCCLVSGDIKIAEEDLLSQRTKSGADDEETETKMFVCVCACVCHLWQCYLISDEIATAEEEPGTKSNNDDEDDDAKMLEIESGTKRILSSTDDDLPPKKKRRLEHTEVCILFVQRQMRNNFVCAECQRRCSDGG